VNKTVSAIGGLFVILVAVVFIVQFRPGSGSGPGASSGPSCATEGICVPTTHYWAAYRLAGGGRDAAYLKSMGLRALVADGLIERWILNQEAKRLGITVSDDEVTEELAKGRAYVSLPADKERMLAFYLGLLSPQPQRVSWETPFRLLRVKNTKTNAFDTKMYDKEVRAWTKLSPSDFREFQREEMIAARMRDLIRSRVHIAEAEAHAEYSRVKATSTVSYLKLSRNFYADLVVDPSQKAVDDWAAKNTDELNKAFESRKSQYKDECRVARHVLAKVREEASEEEKAKAKKKIEKALELVNKGEDFGAVARRFSDDGSASQGGDLGCAPRGQTVEPFEKALYGLEEGKLSGVVTTEFGYHIIKLEKIAKGDAIEKVVKAQLAREGYLKDAADKKAAEAAKSILAAVKSGKSLDDALKTHLEELAAAALPKDEKGAKKDEKAPPKADEKKADEKKDGDKKPEDEIAENPVFTLETHPDRPTVQASAPFNSTGNPIPDAVSTTDLVKQVFALQKPGDLLGDVVPLQEGYAVVQLKEKAPVKKEDWEKDRDEYMSGIRKAKQIDALALYVQRIRQKISLETPIKHNPTIVAEPPDDKGQKGQEPDPEEPGEP
jgi:peptidyl-prolyl cis-trans isomerase D